MFRATNLRQSREFYTNAVGDVGNIQKVCTELHCSEMHYTSPKCSEIKYRTLNCTALQYGVGITVLYCNSTLKFNVVWWKGEESDKPDDRLLNVKVCV